MKNPIQKILIAGIGALLTTTETMQGTPLYLYNNSTVDLGSSLDLVNGHTIGNEIKLAYSSALVTQFSFEIYSTLSSFTGSPQIEAFLYANDGPAFNGYPTPGTVLYSSGFSPLLTPQQSQGVNAATLIYDLSGAPVTVGNDLTLAILVTGLGVGDSVGLELFDPATVGQNYGDYWLENSGWSLLTTGNRTDFGARIEGSPIPDTTSTAMLLGAGFLSLYFLRGKSGQYS